MGVRMLTGLVWVAAMAAGQGRAAAPPGNGFDLAMTPVLAEYLEIQVALANDSFAGVRERGKRIVVLAKVLDPASAPAAARERYRDLPAKLGAAAAALVAATDLAQARTAFKELSKPMALWGTAARPKGITVAYCSMAPGSWLQQGTAIRNPYYGSAMLTCGEIVGGEGFGG